MSFVNDKSTAKVRSDTLFAFKWIATVSYLIDVRVLVAACQSIKCLLINQ